MFNKNKKYKNEINKLIGMAGNLYLTSWYGYEENNMTIIKESIKQSTDLFFTMMNIAIKFKKTVKEVFEDFKNQYGNHCPINDEWFNEYSSAAKNALLKVEI